MNPVRKHLYAGKATALRMCGGMLAVFFACLNASAGTLAVFVPTSDTARHHQQAVAEDLEGALEVIAYGRVRDFARAVRDDTPTVVMAPTQVLESLELTPQLLGERAGSSSEAFVLISVGPLSEQKAEPVYGMVDMVGRSKTPALVARLVGAPPTVSVKRVTRLNDVLPLLQLEIADILLVPESSADAIVATSSLPLVISKVDTAQVGLVAVWFANDTAKTQFEPSLRRLRPQTLTVLGIDSWGGP